MKHSPATALEYLSAVISIGPWSGWLRMGLNQFLDKRFMRSLSSYTYASIFGERDIAYIISVLSDCVIRSFY